jgi:hypothetical protein
MIEIAHQRGTGLPSSHVFGRAAHVDIDKMRAGGFCDTRAFGHPPRIASGDLHHV